MRLSTRGRYGVAALCDLAQRPGDSPVRLRDIALGQGLSESYLEQIFMALRRGGLVQSVRGAQGGYGLSRRPEEITVGEVIRVLEGPIAPVACVTELTARSGGHSHCTRGNPEHCPTRPVWVRLADCMSRVLDSITLADIICGDISATITGCPECVEAPRPGHN